MDLSRLTGETPTGAEAHHVFPVKLEYDFRDLGVNIHDPRHGAWWEKSAHRSAARAYNDAWERAFEQSVFTNADEVFNFGREIAQRYKLKVHY